MSSRPWPILTRKDVFSSTLASLKSNIESERKLPPSPFPETWESKYEPLLERVLALGDDPNLDEVDRILDPSGAETHPRCTACLELRDVVLRFSHDIDDEIEAQFDICRVCLKAAVEQLT
jgi:hypothetical protein